MRRIALSQPRLLALVALAAFLCAAGGARAGTFSLAWDPVEHPELAGYRVFYGTTSGEYDQWQDVGVGTATVLSGLEDCRTYHVAVKSRGADGSLSDVFSDEVSGWARPEVVSAVPAVIERNSRRDVIVDGTNFRPGVTVRFADPAITLHGVTRESCGRLVADVSVSSAAVLGAADVTVVNPTLVFGTGTGLLAVAEDASGPSIAGLEVAEVAATTAVVAWSTDEPADARVFYRRVGDGAFQQTPLATEPSTSHAVLVHGLAPSTAYEFYAASADPLGNETTENGAEPFETDANDYHYVRLEAETAPVDGPGRVASGDGAFRGAWIELAEGAPEGTPGAPSGVFAQGFWLPVAGAWQGWFRVWRPSADEAGWLEEVDGAAMAWVLPESAGAWEWVRGSSYVLDAGLHDLSLGGHRAGARIDRVLLTDDPTFVPSEAPDFDAEPPAAPAGFAAEPGDAAVLLSWDEPAGGDATRLVLRFRADGRTPDGPADGFPLAEIDLGPAAPVVFEHSGLVNDVEVRYAAFLVDRYGNASDAAAAVATPVEPVEPLGAVANVHRTDVVVP